MIERVKVYSSPRSGSHWLSYMLVQNYGVSTSTTAKEKHFFAADAPGFKTHASVCLTRHPIDWAVSKHRFFQSIDLLPGITSPDFFARMLPIYATEWSVFNGANIRDCTYHMRYEDLLANSEETCARLAKSIGLCRITEQWKTTDRHMTTKTTPGEEIFLPSDQHLELYPDNDTIWAFWRMIDPDVLARCQYVIKERTA